MIIYKIIIFVFLILIIVSFNKEINSGAVKDITGNPVTGTNKKPCQPRTKCVWTGGHCCGDGMKWSALSNICTETSDLCYSFWPENKEEGKGVKYSAKQVC